MTRRSRRSAAENADPADLPPAVVLGPDDRGWLTAGVLGVGGASLLSDSSHEMVTSLLPTFLTTTLGAGPAALGAIDGVADALTGVCKLAGGPLATTRTAVGGWPRAGIWARRWPRRRSG